MQVNCGNVQKYLGMKLDYTTVVQLKPTMLEFINEIFNTFDKAYPTGGDTKSSSSPAILS